MHRDPALIRLLASARRADDPARRVVEALVDDPLFASWAADEAVAELDTPGTVRPDRGRLVVHASGVHAHRMEEGVGRLLGSRPRGRGPAGPRDRLLVLLSPGGAADRRGGPDAAHPAECLALVLGDADAASMERLDRLGAVVRRLGEDRSVVAVVQRAARGAGFTPVVLHRHLRGSAAAAGRGLARAARAVAGGMGGVAPPACLILVGPLHAGSGPGPARGPGDPEAPAPGGTGWGPGHVAAAEVASAARIALGEDGGGIRAGAVAVGAGEEARVLAVALVR